MAFILRRAARPASRAVFGKHYAQSTTRSLTNMASQSIPLVLIGRTSEVGKLVEEALKPEYEVIHFLSSAETAATELPLLLTGKPPEQPSAFNIGTQNYSHPPQAVLVGSYFTISMVEALRKQCGDSLNVPWMTAGVTEQQRDEMMKQPMDPTKYGPFVAEKVKGAMARVKEEGKWRRDGVFTFK